MAAAALSMTGGTKQVVLLLVAVLAAVVVIATAPSPAEADCVRACNKTHFRCMFVCNSTHPHQVPIVIPLPLPDHCADNCKKIWRLCLAKG